MADKIEYVYFRTKSEVVLSVEVRNSPSLDQSILSAYQKMIDLGVEDKLITHENQVVAIVHDESEEESSQVTFH